MSRFDDPNAREKLLQDVAPVMLTVLALLADEADADGIREVALHYLEANPDAFDVWLDAEHARSRGVVLNSERKL